MRRPTAAAPTTAPIAIPAIAPLESLSPCAMEGEDIDEVVGLVVANVPDPVGLGDGDDVVVSEPVVV